jgi:hypothetical protein
MKQKAIILTLLFTSVFMFCFAQPSEVSHKINIGIPEVALLGLVSENSIDVTLSLAATQEAGDPVQLSNISNENIWVNYSSIVTHAQHKRKIVAMVEGEIPSGIQVIVKASDAIGSGKGKKGEPTGEVTLTGEPADIIVNIGSCFTGKGQQNGHYLSYKLEVDETAENYNQLALQNSSIQVIYTLTE